MTAHHLPFGQPLGAGRRHVLGVQFVQQIAAHHAHVLGHAAQSGDKHDRPDMLEQINQLGPAFLRLTQAAERPRRHRVLGRVERGHMLLIESEDEGKT